ncbi:Uncharacterised protein [Vibrio cholerae]|nr:Uncharacterised protein [Vibrio cholerae]
MTPPSTIAVSTLTTKRSACLSLQFEADVFTSAFLLVSAY